ncbi:hypothetical protein F7R25_03845 [Burkholderia stagnalis]|uniref:Uncharacterized protein n=1 Tax=Burkholderia stagnalis TaxID=1503054 RepID=A0A6L3N603_9BURK|nr:hypothetical protein [Burkholderia stagnalis]KAB0640637.1 hypothetical protein F7R25_03845 [Burkholderia stagnalis]VWB05803.1 hypothetical protein BST28156_00085 [Burkholderia stagnalis]
METVKEFLDRRESEDVEEALRKSLSHVIALLPEKNADMFIHTLSLLPKEERKRYVEYCQREEIISNKAPLMVVYGLLASYKAIADQVEAARVAENMMLKVVPGVVQSQLDDFKDKIIDIQAHVVAETENMLIECKGASDHLGKQLDDFKSLVETAVGIVEKAYSERAKLIEARGNDQVKRITAHADSEIVRINSKSKDIELILTERAVKEFRRAIASSIARAFGWKGFLWGVGVVTTSIFFYDFIHYMALKIFH